MTALQRVRASLTAGERPSDDDVRAVCADAERYVWLRANAVGYAMHMGAVLYTPELVIPRNFERHADTDAAIDAALREPK